MDEKGGSPKIAHSARAESMSLRDGLFSLTHFP